MSGLEKRRLRAGNFIKNNGRVLKTINILRYRYNKLSGVQSALHSEGVSEDEFLDAVNFLAEEGYIELREIATREIAKLADIEYEMIEAKVTAKGIRFLAGGLEDNMIEI